MSKLKKSIDLTCLFPLQLESNVLESLGSWIGCKVYIRVEDLVFRVWGLSLALSGF